MGRLSCPSSDVWRPKAFLSTELRPRGCGWAAVHPSGPRRSLLEEDKHLTLRGQYMLTEKDIRSIVSII